MNIRLAIVSVAAVAALAACGGGTEMTAKSPSASSSTASSSPSPSSSSSTTNDTTQPEDADADDAEDAIKSFAVGDTATVTQGDEDAATILVTKAVKTRTPEMDYADKPENGRFLVATMTVKNVGTEPFDINPYDFYVVDGEGNHYDYGDGNVFGAIDGKEIHAVTLNKGEKVTGRVAFDIPNKAVNLVYAPGQQALGQWPIKK